MGDQQAGTGPGERKVATVLFADIVGSTTLGEALDVEPLQEVLGAFHRASTGAIRSCGGTVDISGDAVIGAFGVPDALEDHAGRALRAACLILRRVDELDRGLGHILGVHLAVRIGVNTGQVLVPPGTPDLSALLGDTWNVAARLEHTAAPGQVMVSQRTASASHGWQLEDVGPVRLEGRREPVRGFRLIGEPHPASRSTAPLLGRDAVVGRLCDLLTSPEGPRLVTIVGEAGVGKTRLFEAVSAAITDPAARIVVATGCPPFGAEGALVPLMPVIPLENGTGGADPENLTAMLTAELPRGTGSDPAQDADTLLRTVGLLSGGDGPGGVPGTARGEVRAAWANYLAALTSHKEMVVLVEDLHWAEPELVDLLATLAERRVGAVRFLVSFRPEFLEDHPEWGRNTPDTVIPLAPLDHRVSVHLARWLLEHHGLVVDRSEELAALGEGNPFFITELVRAVAETGSVDPGADATAMPDTVQAVLAQRIDRLGPWEKQVLQAASAVGRLFWPEVLTAALEAEPDRVMAALEELERRRYLLPGPTGEIPVHPTFRFDHALTMDVAYASIPRRRLHGIHDRIAEWLRGSGWEGATALQAEHRLRAYEASRADWVLDDVERRRLRSAARDQAMEAAHRALAQTSPMSARRWAGAALQLAEVDPERVDALEVLGNASFVDYDGDEAWACLTKAIDLARTTSCRSPIELAALSARALDSPIRWPGGMRVLPPVERLLEYMQFGFRCLPPGPSVARVRLLTLRGFWQYAASARVGGESPVTTTQSLSAARSAADMAAGLGRPDLESAALDGLASNYITAGAYTRATEVTARRLALVDRIDSAAERGDICAVGAWTLHHVGRYREAEQWATRGIECTIAEYPMVALHCLNWRGITRYRLGDWEGVETDLDQARTLLGEAAHRPPPYAGPLFAAAAAVFDRQSLEQRADEVLSTLASLDSAADVGDRDVAPLARWSEYLGPVVARRGRCTEALAMIDGTHWRRDARLGHLMSARCEVIGEGKRWDLAEEQVAAALALSRRHGLKATEAAGHLLAGRHALAGDDPGEAVRELTRAEARFAEIGAGWDLAVARWWLADALLRRGDAGAAVERRHLAVDGFVALGAGAEPERLLEHRSGPVVETSRRRPSQSGVGAPTSTDRPGAIV